MEVTITSTSILRHIGLLETMCFQITDADNHWQIIDNNAMVYTNMITRRHYNTYGSKR